MPELPEVETVCRGLRQLLPGKTIEAVDIKRHDLRRPVPSDLPEQAEGRRIESIERRAKYILVRLEGGQTLLVHLGMSGKVLVVPEHQYQPKKHDHVLFRLSDGNQVTFNDPRRFGLVTLMPEEEEETHPLLRHLGIEPLSDIFTGAWLHAALKHKTAPIKTTLMDAGLIVGVGNIYAAEALFLAHISPLRKAGSLRKKECDALVPAIKQVLEAAIASGGSTLRDYVRSSGETGYFQHHFAVYGKANEPCEICQKPIERIKQAGRSTFFCRTCQV